MRMIVSHCKNQPILWNVTYFCCTVSMMRCWRNVVADLCSVWFRKVHQLKHQHGEFLLVCPKFAPFAQSFLWSPTLLALPSLPRKAIPGKMRKIKNVKSWCSSRQRMNSRLSQCEIRICFPGWFCCNIPELTLFTTRFDSLSGGFCKIPIMSSPEFHWFMLLHPISFHLSFSPKKGTNRVETGFGWGCKCESSRSEIWSNAFWSM